MNTPDWIGAIIDDCGGWFAPLELSVDHPLVCEGWACMYCQQPFEEGDTGFVMPFHDETDEERWVAAHGRCIREQVGTSDG